MQIRKIVAVAAASVVAATGLVACSSSDSSEFAAVQDTTDGTTIFVDRLEETTSK
ncbi:hypothetical protein [Corynebacterium striatum]|uniref:hypothetical protein n=1 Tax=Corynebacterium striatum TaxID=43770 RepID=UPI00254D88DE|nr:hypothetical protein [Corynebacterium striatum]MDK7885074.1 hypothetical protein [Corynebacterium striatum]